MSTARGPGRPPRSRAIRCLAPAVALAVAVLPVRLAEARRAPGAVQVGGRVMATCYVQILEARPVVDVIPGLRDFPLATIGERCNAFDGYRVVISSHNRGALVGAAGERLGYRVSYGPLRNASLADPRAVDARSAQTTMRTRTLALSIPDNQLALAQAYRDLVVVSIEAR